MLSGKGDSQFLFSVEQARMTIYTHREGRWGKAFCENYYIEYWSEESCYWQTLSFLRGMKGKKIEFGANAGPGEPRNMLYRQERRLPSKPLIYKLANKGPLLSSGTTSKEHGLTRP